LLSGIVIRLGKWLRRVSGECREDGHGVLETSTACRLGGGWKRDTQREVVGIRINHRGGIGNCVGETY
jgi:hypothetical protein